MNVLGVKEEGHGNFLFRVKFRLSCMITCPECNQCFAEIDGSCALCRSLRRLALEARAVAPALRGWVVDQTRVWVSLLQEESLKWGVAQAEARRQEEARQAAAAATSKAGSPVVASSLEAEVPAGEKALPVKTEPAEESTKGECVISPGTISSPPGEEQTEPQEEEVSVRVKVEEKEASPAKKKKKDKKKKTRERTCHEREKSASAEKTHTKRDKATKRNKKSSSRSRKRRRRSEDRRRSSSRSERRSAAKGSRRPPEPAYPPSEWHGQAETPGYYTPRDREYRSYSSQGWTYYTPRYGEYAEESPPRWGTNKGLTKRKKQAEWRRYSGRSRWWPQSCTVQQPLREQAKLLLRLSWEGCEDWGGRQLQSREKREWKRIKTLKIPFWLEISLRLPLPQ